MSTSFTSPARITSTADLIADTAAWLRTDQAAIMRQLPEQQSAYQWWKTSGREHADSVVTVPAWIEHFYGLPVTARPDHPRLSATAAAVAELLANRARQLSNAPVYLIRDHATISALLALSRSSYYARPDGLWPAAALTGTIICDPSVPIRQHTAPLAADEDAPIDRDRNPELLGWTWFGSDTSMRVIDWIRTGIDTTGNSSIDTAIADHVTPADLPPMLNNGEWEHPIKEHCPMPVCRARLAAATAEVARVPKVHWAGGIVDDADTLLVPRLAAATVDAITAGLLEVSEHRVRRRRRSGRRPRTITTVTAAHRRGPQTPMAAV